MRPSIGGIRPAVGLFQSTHPVWDATDRLLRLLPTRGISIHASRMGCDRWKCSADRGRAISIHASRMGCDLAVTLIIHGRMHFNPRIPYGMRHAGRLDLNYFRGISIHASRMGCDAACRVYHRRLMDFNPRIPYGMRLREWTLHSIIWKLLPALRADYIADIPEHLSVCIFGL